MPFWRISRPGSRQVGPLARVWGKEWDQQQPDVEEGDMPGARGASFEEGRGGGDGGDRGEEEEGGGHADAGFRRWERAMGGKASFAVRAGMEHDFRPVQLTVPTWCDSCSGLIWGISRRGKRCARCEFLVHPRCSTVVYLDCGTHLSIARTSEAESMRSSEADDALSSESTGTVRRHASALTSPQPPQPPPPHNGSVAVLRLEEVSDYHAAARAYEQWSGESVQVVVDEAQGAFFSGTLTVEFRLSRPVVVGRLAAATDVLDIDGPCGATRGTVSSEQSLALDADGTVAERKRSRPAFTFYIDAGVCQRVQLSSRTSVRRLRQALLACYGIADDDRKFDLRTVDGEVLGDADRPLLAVIAQATETQHCSVVRPGEPVPALVLSHCKVHCEDASDDSDGGSIARGVNLEALSPDDDPAAHDVEPWTRFSLEELEIFLRMLILSEERAVQLIRQNYDRRRRQILARLKAHGETSVRA